MNFGDWEAKLYQPPGSMCYDLYLTRRRPQGREYLTSDGVIKTFANDEVPDPECYFARFYDDGQVQAIANAFAAHGIKTPNDHRNEGLLEATRLHLDDMRSIVFKQRPQRGGH